MSLTALETAIYARAIGDTGTGGLRNASAPLVTGIFNTFRKPREGETDAQVYPYVVFNVADWDADSAFTVEVATALVRFNVYHPRDLVPASGSTLAKCNAITARLFGNGLTQASRIPTYGFHRWQPTLSGTLWVAESFIHRRSLTLHSEDMLQYVEEYSILLSNKGS